MSVAGQFQRAQRLLRTRSARTPNTHPTMRQAGGSNTATRSNQLTLPPSRGMKTQSSSGRCVTDSAPESPLARAPVVVPSRPQLHDLPFGGRDHFTHGARRDPLTSP